MSKQVSNKITYLNFILACLILNLHSAYMDLFDTNQMALDINQVIRIICNMSVPTFFFISSLLFYHSCDDVKYINVVKKKMFSLLIPYLIWNIICFPLKEFKNYLFQGFITHKSAAEM